MLTGSTGSDRLRALRDAAIAVCPTCGGCSFPDRHMPLSGPNEAMNYVHVYELGGKTRRELCDATSIWSIVRFEWDLEEVARQSPRGWKTPAQEAY